MICDTCKSNYEITVMDVIRDNNKKYQVSICPVCENENFIEINNHRKYDYSKHRTKHVEPLLQLMLQ